MVHKHVLEFICLSEVAAVILVVILCGLELPKFVLSESLPFTHCSGFLVTLMSSSPPYLVKESTWPVEGYCLSFRTGRNGDSGDGARGGDGARAAAPLEPMLRHRAAHWACLGPVPSPEQGQKWTQVPKPDSPGSP